MNRKQIKLIIDIIIIFSFLVVLTGCSDKKYNDEKDKISNFSIVEKNSELQDADESKKVDNKIEDTQSTIKQNTIGDVLVENDNESTKLEKEKIIEEKNESSSNVLQEENKNNSLQSNSSTSKEATIKETTSKEDTSKKSTLKENAKIEETNTVVKNKQKETYTYVLNNNTKKFHYSNCSSVKQIKKINYDEYTGTREDLIGKGYIPCKKCNP